MYVSAMFTCLLRGRSTPEIRAIKYLYPYPCRCLCFEFSQITRTTPLRCTILHLSQIFLTDALTFMSLFSSNPVWHRHSCLCSLFVSVHDAPTRQIVR